MTQRLGKSGFTLLELLVVVIIVAILAGVAIPQYRKAIEGSRETDAQNVLASIFTGELAYYQEKGTFTTTLTDLVVSVPVMKDWSAPAGTSSGLTSVVTFTTGGASAPPGGHSHAGHFVTGVVSATGQKGFSSVGA